MKNYILLIISVLLFMGCHLKKKSSEINTVDQQKFLQTTKDVKTQTTLKVVQIDSSKIIKSNIDNMNYWKSIDIEFELTPNKKKSILISDKTNSAFFEQLLNKSQKVKIHINHIQQKSNSQVLTQQNNIRSKIDSSVNKEETFEQLQKINTKEKNMLSSESKTYTTLMWWVIVCGILITVYVLMNKFNIYSLIVGLFKK